MEASVNLDVNVVAFLDPVGLRKLGELVFEEEPHCRIGECRFLILVHTTLGPAAPICARLGMKNTFQFCTCAKIRFYV